MESASFPCSYAALSDPIEGGDSREPSARDPHQWVQDALPGGIVLTQGVRRRRSARLPCSRLRELSAIGTMALEGGVETIRPDRRQLRQCDCGSSRDPLAPAEGDLNPQRRRDRTILARRGDFGPGPVEWIAGGASRDRK